MDDEHSDVVSLDDVRRQRMLDEMIEEAQKNPIEPSIDMLGKEFQPFLWLAGGPDLARCHLRIIFHDVSDGRVDTAGALSLHPAQWEQLKEQVDRMLQAHTRVLADSQSS